MTKCDVLFAEMEISPVWKGQTLANENISRLEHMGFELVARDCQKWFQFNALFVRKGLLDAPWLTSAIERYAERAKTAFLED